MPKLKPRPRITMSQLLTTLDAMHLMLYVNTSITSIDQLFTHFRRAIEMRLEEKVEQTMFAHTNAKMDLKAFQENKEREQQYAIDRFDL